jgi:hypothetical protein
MSDSARLAVGLPCAYFLPAFLPWIRSRAPAAAATSGLLAVWACAGAGHRPLAWALGVAAVALQFSRPRAGSRNQVPWKVALADSSMLLIAGAFSLAAAAAVDVDSVWDLFRRSVQSDRGLLVCLGALFAVFPVGAVIGRLISPWATAIEGHLEDDPKPPRGLEGAGRYVGWLERTAIYFAVVLGHPEGIAVVLTAKSIARFPSFSREAFAEYYLIGTLLSVLGATAVGIGVRLMLDLGIS